MPISRTVIASGGVDYGSPFVGPVEHTLGINVNIAALTTREVDVNGVLKPGVPFQRAGTLISGASQSIFGCVVEATKVAASNAAGDLTAAGTKEIAVAFTACAVNRDILEDILGSAITANELAAFGIGFSRVALID